MTVTHTFKRGTHSVYVEIAADTECFLVRTLSGEFPTDTFSPGEFLGVCTAEDMETYANVQSPAAAETPYRTSLIRLVFPSMSHYSDFRVKLHEDLIEFAGENLDWSWSDTTVSTVTLTDSETTSGPFFFTQEV